MQCNVEMTLLGFRFLEAMCNGNCGSALHQVQLANAQTRHYSYTSVRQKLVVASRGFCPNEVSSVNNNNLDAVLSIALQFQQGWSTT